MEDKKTISFEDNFVKDNVSYLKDSAKLFGKASANLVKYAWKKKVSKYSKIILCILLFLSVCSNIYFYIEAKQSIDKANHKTFMLQQKLDSIQNTEQKEVNLTSQDLNKYFK